MYTKTEGQLFAHVLSKRKHSNRHFYFLVSKRQPCNHKIQLPDVSRPSNFQKFSRPQKGWKKNRTLDGGEGVWGLEKGCWLSPSCWPSWTPPPSIEGWGGVRLVKGPVMNPGKTRTFFLATIRSHLISCFEFGSNWSIMVPKISAKIKYSNEDMSLLLRIGSFLSTHWRFWLNRAGRRSPPCPGVHKTARIFT